MVHNHTFWWRFFPKKELTQIYLSLAVRSFAISLISLFVPLYLYHELGYSLTETLLFFVVYSISLALACPFAAKFSAKFGCKHSVLVSAALYILFLGGLSLLPTIKINLGIIAAVQGLSLAFFWMGMHIVFRKASDQEHRGEEMGKRESLTILATMLGPLVGGFLIKFWGFKLVFLLTSLLLFLSASFLFISKEKHISYHFYWKSLLNKKHWKDSLFFISRGSRVMAAGVIWPLFVFIILNDYFSLGVVESLLAGISALLVWLFGKFSDRWDKHKLLHLASLLESLSWFARVTVNTVGQVFGVTLFGALTYGALESPAGALEYDKARGNLGAYFVIREVYLCIGRLLVLAVVFVFGTLSSGMIFNGIATLAGLLF